MDNKKISIITINKNDFQGLQKTIKSIIVQKKIYELIVIDGKSSDKSLNFIRKYQKKITNFISEKDTNISDAFNKGIKLSTSEWILFLNSGDYFYNKDVLALIERDLSYNKSYDLLIYQLVFQKKKESKLFGGKKTDLNKMKLYNVIPHQSLIMKKSLFKKYGKYSLDFPIAQDYEFLLRGIKDFKIKKIDKIISIMTYGGITESNEIKSLIAFLKAKNKNKINYSIINYLIFIYGFLKVILKKIIKLN